MTNPLQAVLKWIFLALGALSSEPLILACGRDKIIRSNGLCLVNQLRDRSLNRVAVIAHVPEFCKTLMID